MSNAIQREITNKATGEIYRVLATEFDTVDPNTPKVNFTTDIGVISFSNEGLAGNLLNDEYTVAEVSDAETEVDPAA